MQDAAQQKKPKGKRAPAGNTPCLWGFLGRALEHEPHSRATESPAKQPSATVVNPQVQVHGGGMDQQTPSGDAVQSAETLALAGDQLAHSGDRPQDRDGADPHAADANVPLEDQQTPSAATQGFGLLPPGAMISVKSAKLSCASQLCQNASQLCQNASWLCQSATQTHLCCCCLSKVVSVFAIRFGPLKSITFSIFYMYG